MNSVNDYSTVQVPPRKPSEDFKRYPRKTCIQMRVLAFVATFIDSQILFAWAGQKIYEIGVLPMMAWNIGAFFMTLFTLFLVLAACLGESKEER